MMKLTEELANKVFDVIITEGKHSQTYEKYYREEFVSKVTTDGLYEHWYPTEAGSSIKVYFLSGNEAYFHAQTLNASHDKDLTKEANAKMRELGFRTPSHAV